MSAVATAATAAERIRDADDLLRATRASFLVIRGQCHRVVRVANRPQELIAALTVIEREVARLTDGVGRARRLLSDECPLECGDHVVDPHAVVYDAVDRFGAAAAERGIVLRVGTPTAAWSRAADGETVRRAVDRMLEAAITDAPAGGCLTLTVRASGPHANDRPDPAAPFRGHLPGVA